MSVSFDVGKGSPTGSFSVGYVSGNCSNGITSGISNEYRVDSNLLIRNASQQNVRMNLVVVMLQNYLDVIKLKNEVHSYRDHFKENE